MPNHCLTEITGPPQAIIRLLDDNGQVDFHQVIPGPVGDPDYESPMCAHNSSLTDDGHDKHPNCWNAWNRDNWGTKWNGYDTEPIKGTDGDAAVLRFQTAWSHPVKVIVALSQAEPEALFTIRFADEDLGHNMGEYQIRNGDVSGVPEPTLTCTSPEWGCGCDTCRDWARSLRYDDADDLYEVNLDDGTVVPLRRKGDG